MGQQATVDICIRHDSETGRWTVLGCQGTVETYPVKWCDTRERAVELARAERERCRQMGIDSAIHVAGACPADCELDQPVPQLIQPTIKAS